MKDENYKLDKSKSYILTSLFSERHNFKPVLLHFYDQIIAYILYLYNCFIFCYLTIDFYLQIILSFKHTIC